MANVYVGCKLPSGIRIHVEDRIEILTVGQSNPTRKEVLLNGANYEHNNRKFTDRPSIIGASGYGITSVDADFWARWVDANKDGELYRSGVIFAVKSHEAAFKEAKNREKLRTGLDPACDADLKNVGVEVSARAPE